MIITPQNRYESYEYGRTSVDIVVREESRGVEQSPVILTYYWTYVDNGGNTVEEPVKTMMISNTAVKDDVYTTYTAKIDIPHGSNIPPYQKFTLVADVTDEARYENDRKYFKVNQKDETPPAITYTASGFNYVCTDNKEISVTVTDAAGNSITKNFIVDYIDKEAPIGTITYTPNSITNRNVRAVLTLNEPAKILNNNGKVEYVFTQNGEFVFEFEIYVGNKGTITAVVDWIDRVVPKVSLEYSNTERTNKPVEVTVITEEGSIIINNGGSAKRTFYRNGEFTFMVRDLAGNIAEIKAEVKNIDAEPPALKLRGVSYVALFKDEAYTEEGFTASDNIDGDLTDDVIVEGSVDTATPGEYILKYTVSDAVGNITEVIRTVKVLSPDELVILLNDEPVFTMDFSSQHGNINVEKDENGNNVYYTNARYIDCRYQSDKTGKAIFYVNGEKVDDTKEKNYSFQLDLDDGSNLIEVEVTGDNGDKSTKSYEFYYDDRAPELMVQRPNNYEITQSGSILVSGLTTAGSRLYVNGSEVNVGDDGSFNENYVLTNNDRETITITSMDLAGNMTEYTAEVLNSSVNDVVKVQIRPDISQLRAGESVQLNLYGVTMDNNELLLASDKVSWQIYGDEGTAAITSGGRLTANRTGEIVVSGRYILSPDKAYEDAIIINIIPNLGNRDDDRDRDRDNKTDEKESNESSSLIRRRMNFQANEEIRLPGHIRIKFTGREELPKGYLEIHEIKDLLKYRPKSGKKSFVSNIFDIRVPEGYELNSPVELTIYFNKDKVKDLKRIFIYGYNEKTGQWDMAGGTVDEVQGAITVRLLHFSLYAVMENSELTIMTDMDSHWVKDAVYRLVDMGIVNGIKSADDSYKYEPEKPVTRAEFSKMLALSSGYVNDNNDVDLSDFEDDEEILAWVRPYLKYCSENGWIKGKAAGSKIYMKPNDTITRAEAGVMISRALGFEAKDKNIKAAFPDKNEIPDWAAGYIDELVDKKLMHGRPDGAFRPNEVMNRAEVAALIDNYVRMQNDSY